MFGGHAGAETNSIQRNGRVIDRSDPKTATAQFVTKAIHAFTLTDHDRHDERGRCSSIDAEPSQLRMKIVGIVPKLSSQLRLFGSNLEGLDYRGHYHGRQRTRVHIWMCVIAQILNCLRRTRYETAKRSEGLGKCAVNKGDLVFHFKLLSRTATVLTTAQHRMRFIDENAGVMSLGHRNQFLEIAEVAIHRINPFDD